MAGSTEVNGIGRCEPARVEDQFFPSFSASLHGCNMLCSRSMAGFASHTRDQMLGIKCVVSSGCRRVAAEASVSFGPGQRPSGRLLERLWRGIRVARCQIESLDGAEITQTALEVGPILLEEISLTNPTAAADGKRQRYG